MSKKLVADRSGTANRRTYARLTTRAGRFYKFAPPHRRRKVKMADFYKANVIRALLPAIDNLERALKHAPKDLKDHEYVKGVQGVVKQFEKALHELGVERNQDRGRSF